MWCIRSLHDVEMLLSVSHSFIWRAVIMLHAYWCLPIFLFSHKGACQISPCCPLSRTFWSHCLPCWTISPFPLQRAEAVLQKGYGWYLVKSRIPESELQYVCMRRKHCGCAVQILFAIHTYAFVSAGPLSHSLAVANCVSSCICHTYIIGHMQSLSSDLSKGTYCIDPLLGASAL